MEDFAPGNIFPWKSGGAELLLAVQVMKSSGAAVWACANRPCVATSKTNAKTNILLFPRLPLSFARPFVSFPPALTCRRGRRRGESKLKLLSPGSPHHWHCDLYPLGYSRTNREPARG